MVVLLVSIALWAVTGTPSRVDFLALREEWNIYIACSLFDSTSTVAILIPIEVYSSNSGSSDSSSTSSSTIVVAETSPSR